MRRPARKRQNTKSAAAAYFLGIDGGGSMTTAWLSNSSRRILGRAVAGPSNPTKVGLEVALRNIFDAAHKARREAGLGRQRLEAVCAGIAGIASPIVYRKLLRSLKNAIPAQSYLLTHDAAIALECALGSSLGVIVISGTGSIAYGRNSNNQLLRCGGWGSVFDDAGSGYDIGRKAVCAALRDFDGRGIHTRLGKDICRALKISKITDVAAKAFTPNEVAALFPVIVRAARGGDQVARQLCSEAGRDLAELASVLLRRLGDTTEENRVVCAGGVFKASAGIRQSFARQVHQTSPDAKITLLRGQPVEGALALAISLARNSKAKKLYSR